MALSTETEALTLMLHHILSDSESDVGQSCFKEETIEKVMQELYKEIMAEPSPTSTLFSSLPSSSDASLVVQVQPQDESTEIEVIHDQKTCNGDFDCALLESDPHS